MDPGGTVLGYQRRGRSVDCPIHSAPCCRGIRRDRDPGSKTGGRYVERRWRPHQLLDEGDARGEWYRRNREGDRQAQQTTSQTHPGVRSARREG